MSLESSADPGYFQANNSPVFQSSSFLKPDVIFSQVWKQQDMHCLLHYLSLPVPILKYLLSCQHAVFSQGFWVLMPRPPQQRLTPWLLSPWGLCSVLRTQTHFPSLSFVSGTDLLIPSCTWFFISCLYTLACFVYSDLYLPPC